MPMCQAARLSILVVVMPGSKMGSWVKVGGRRQNERNSMEITTNHHPLSAIPAVQG